MAQKKLITVGKSSFGQMIERNNYFVDKTSFLKPFIEYDDETILFTRPRRFGKTLTMDMIKEFFCLNYENDPDYEARQKNLFKDLEISKDREFCDEHMGKYPVISVSFQGTDDDSNCQNAISALYRVIAQLFDGFKFLLDNPALDAKDRKNFLCCQNLTGAAVTDENTNWLKDSLDLLVRLLNKCYKEDVIVLIDEYDVPLQNARANGFYREMLNIFRRLAQVGKPKSGLRILRCVFTGCLRISKESIFTGLNNVQVFGISSEDYKEFFGFTDAEVDRLLAYYGVSDKKALIKEWYDGYNFFDVSIYCPWDVMSYLRQSVGRKDQKPKNYWANTSSNSILYEFISYANNENMLLTLNRLLRGETVACRVDEEFTYPDLEQDHADTQLFSILYLTGYLTCVGQDEAERYLLKIPNLEISNLFGTRILSYFQKKALTQTENAKKLCGFLLAGDAGGTENILADAFFLFLSVQDTKYEQAYHSFVLGMLSTLKRGDFPLPASEKETGDGYADITLEDRDSHTAAVLEFKVCRAHGSDEDIKTPTDREALMAAAGRGLKQIKAKRYARRLLEDYETVWCFGIGCYGKRVAVMADRLTR